MNQTRVAIVGAGPAGIETAWQAHMGSCGSETMPLNASGGPPVHTRGVPINIPPKALWSP